MLNMSFMSLTDQSNSAEATCQSLCPSLLIMFPAARQHVAILDKLCQRFPTENSQRTVP